MMTFFSEYGTYIIPGLIIAGSFLLGIIFEKLVLFIVSRITKRLKLGDNTLVVKALKGEIVITFVMLGIYVTEIVFDLPLPLKQVSEKALVVILILMVSLFASRILSGIIKAYFLRHESIIFPATLITNIIKISVLSTGALVILNFLDISIIPIITTLGIGGIAVALALQPTLSNLFSGFQLLLSKQLKPGDFIRLTSGEEGYVLDISWRHTVIRTLSENLVTVPNAKLADSIFTNFYQPDKELAVTVDVGVSYESDLAQVEAVTVGVARSVMKEVQGGVPGFDPIVRFHTFDDYAIRFTVVMKVQSYVDQYLVKHEFVKRLHERYKAEGIVIPFPIRTIHTFPLPESSRK
jgi:small-conductance mechanosensitive channel